MVVALLVLGSSAAGTAGAALLLFLRVLVDLPLLALPLLLPEESERALGRLVLLLELLARLFDLVDELPLPLGVVLRVRILDLGKLVALHQPAALAEQTRHRGSVVHMADHELRAIHVIQARDALDGRQAAHAADAAVGETEEIAQDPVVAVVAVDEPSRDHVARPYVLVLLHDDGAAEDVHVLHEPDGILFR